MLTLFLLNCLEFTENMFFEISIKNGATFIQNPLTDPHSLNDSMVKYW
jgi:hypothetical protein